MSDLLKSISQMKVVELRKELKKRGLSSVGIKSMLAARLQAALCEETQDDHGDVTLDSYEIDSDCALASKSHNDILDDKVNRVSNQLQLAEEKTESNEISLISSMRVPKRKVSSPVEDKETCNKIVVSYNSTEAKSKEDNHIETEARTVTSESIDTNRIKITVNMDHQTKLELRAKRFGLPVKLTENQRKEIRRYRFGQNATSLTKTCSSQGIDNISKLTKRADRFGLSVSKSIEKFNDTENKEKLEKRKAKFGIV